MDTPRNIKELRQLRIAQHRTLVSVASEAEIHPSHLSKIERGLVEPSPLVESQLEMILGLPTNKPTNTDEESNEKLDVRNKLNDLTGREWIQETATVWRQKGLGVDHPDTKYEKFHPAPFSFQDVARLIRFFTKKGMLVLDPFVGVGSTLKAAALEERRGLGIELSEKWATLSRQRLKKEVPDASQQQIWCMDIRDALKRIEPESVDFIVTSPPYWNILNKKPDHKVKKVRVANGLDLNYSEDVRDLGNIVSYDNFISELVEIFEELADKLVSGKYCAIIVSDFKHKDRYYAFHSDLLQNLNGKKLSLEGITILHQTHKSLYPYSYPFAYVPNIHHQYILLFRKSVRAQDKVAKRRTKKDILRVPTDIDERLTALKKLPHKQGDMAGRHWGHQRHAMCSFPSKMKPALAAVLVELFSIPESVVLDPLAGCGTIPFEAALQGREAIAGDLSSLAYVISSSKITPPNKSDYDGLLNQLEDRIQMYASKISLDEMEPEIREFYDFQTAREIIIARSFLSEVSDGFKSNSAALFITACLAHILHGNRPYALSRRSHNIIPIPPKGPKVYKSVMASLRDKCARMLSFPLPPSFRQGKCYCGAVENIPLSDSTVDVVITSPPFLGTTHFLRQNRIRNWLVGWNYETQAKHRDKFLEHKRDVSPYGPFINELHRIVRPGGLAVFHVGIVKTKNMADLLHPYFRAEGFSHLGSVWEDTTTLESHGRTDRGGTSAHGFIVYRRD